jgi:hypothetical protein
MKRFALVVTNQPWEEAAEWVTVGTVHASSWKMAARWFRFAKPEVMAMFGSGRVAIVTA